MMTEGAYPAVLWRAVARVAKWPVARCQAQPAFASASHDPSRLVVRWPAVLLHYRVSSAGQPGLLGSRRQGQQAWGEPGS
eukprot:COSAG05_NODE_183_length_14758_cov_90.142506_9_plen_80_part_00